MGRFLIYTCCSSEYYMFIPLFCFSHLLHNSNADIEIGICDSNLDWRTEHALDIIRNNFPNNKIVIDYNAFSSGYYNGKHVLNNTLRFLIEPNIKDEYTYITDIDIICCESIYESHINDMRANNSNYSNIVRKNTNRLTGLHFTKTSSYYPLPDISNINIADNDEIVLYNIVSKRETIDLNRVFRPVHGIHMSLNRESVSGTKSIPGWGAANWQGEWEDINKHPIYNEIYKLFSPSIIVLIQKLEDFYADR